MYIFWSTLDKRFANFLKIIFGSMRSNDERRSAGR